MSEIKLEPKAFIGSKLRIKLKDTRVLDGILTVIDPFGNILISDGYEYSVDRINPAKVNKREVGLVSVPRESVVNVSVDKKTHARLFN